MAKPTQNSMFQSLKRLSAQLGSDPLQVQGAGGNTSLKQDGTLWIKASGTWLMNAESTDMFVPVSLSQLLEALRLQDPRAEKASDFVVQEQNPSGLRPSIETSLHAVLPQAIVVHTHCVDTISLAIRTDAKERLAVLLSEFDWLWVPYLKPGLPLSYYVDQHKTASTDVIVLGNHGLVVAADTVAGAEALMLKVRAALKQPVKDAASIDSSALSDVIDHPDYEPAKPNTYRIASDPHSLSVAASGSLYPDHVIFLGDALDVLQPNETIRGCVERVAHAGKPEPIAMVVPGKGVVIKRSANPGQHAMVQCINDVTARLSEDDAIEYLTDEAVYQLTHWEAEHYRQSLSEAD